MREAGEDDAGAISTLLEDAFGRPDEERLLRSLHESGALAAVLVEEDGGRVVAVAVLSHLDEPKGSLGLGPLAVARDRRNEGHGKALIGASVEWARRAGHGAIFVLGQPSYYQRFGFTVAAARPYRSPYPAEFLMALEIAPGALQGGNLRYAPAFAALS